MLQVEVNVRIRRGGGSAAIEGRRCAEHRRCLM